MITKRVFILNGSASKESSNLALINYIKEYELKDFVVEVMEDLSVLPHFSTEFTDVNVPEKVTLFRRKLSEANAILICTPEYVFSIPSRLKNALEWCVSTTVLTDKPLGLITASANGEKGHEELKLIMSTLQAKVTSEAMLLIKGIKGKIDLEGEISDHKTLTSVQEFASSFKKLID